MNPNVRKWEFGTYEIRMTEEGRKILGKERIKLYQVHQDIVTRDPENSIVWGETEKTRNQGFIIGNNIFTFQGHPEFSKKIMHSLVDTFARKNILPSEELEMSKNSLQQLPDSSFLGNLLSEFVRKNVSK